MALARSPLATRYLVACAVVVFATACGTSASAPAPKADGAASSGAVVTAAPTGGRLAFGTEQTFTGGLGFTVSVPKSVHPGDTAYPRSDRATAFDIVVTNGGTDPYRLSGLSVTASIGGKPVKQVIDTTQGYGIVDTDRDLQPGKTAHLSLAFAVPDEVTRLTLVLRPDPSERIGATYYGEV